MKAFTILGLTSLAFQAVVTAEPNVAALRTIMTDSRFVGLVSPCTVGGTTRTTAAEWLRTAFHDAGSYDAQAGTGGIDGSIAFETTRAENFGPFLTATINQYKTFQQEGVSLADLVVLGAITAVGACGGPAIPFHAGRLDAATPAEEGRLPLPEETTETHLQKFARMGFSPEEMVTLVACGHTIGGVHGPNTPLVTSERIKPFDSSRIVFDNVVAKEYVNGSIVNPLGQPFDPSKPNDLANLAKSSDSRTFAVDGNATMNRYAASQDAFFTDCVASFSKMFDQAVPAGTQLTAAISPFAVNIGALITLRNERLNLQSGSARLYGMTGKYSSVSLTYTNRDGSPGSNPTMIFARAPRTINNGQPIDLVDFSTRTAVDPVAGIHSVKTIVTLNDGTVYSSPDGTENLRVDDTILIDQGAAFTCKHDNGGINVTIAVLGPYDRADKVEVIWDKVSDPTRTTMGAPILADYRRQRPDTPFIYYGAFIPSAIASDIANFGARLTRASGAVFQDTKQGVMHRVSALDACVAGAEIPLPGPRPTGGITARAIRSTCPVRGQTRCQNECVDTRSNIFHCGGCSFAGGQDCSEMGDDVECVQGKCIVSSSLL